MGCAVDIRTGLYVGLKVCRKLEKRQSTDCKDRTGEMILNLKKKHPKVTMFFFPHKTLLQDRFLNDWVVVRLNIFPHLPEEIDTILSLDVHKKGDAHDYQDEKVKSCEE